MVEGKAVTGGSFPCLSIKLKELPLATTSFGDWARPYQWRSCLLVSFVLGHVFFTCFNCFGAYVWLLPWKGCFFFFFFFVGSPLSEGETGHRVFTAQWKIFRWTENFPWCTGFRTRFPLMDGKIRRFFMENGFSKCALYLRNVTLKCILLDLCRLHLPQVMPIS